MTVETQLRRAAADTNRTISGLTPPVRSRRWRPILAGSAAALAAAVAVAVVWIAAGTTPDSMARFGTRVEAEIQPTASLTEVNLADELVELDGTPMANLEVRHLKADDTGTIWLTVADLVPQGEMPLPSRIYGFDGRDWWRLEVPYDFWTGVIAGDQDELWVGTWEGPAVFDGESWTLHTPDDGAPRSAISSAEIAPNGDLWFYSNGLLVADSIDDEPYWWAHSRVSHFDGSAWRHWEPVEETEMTRGWLALDDAGGVWIASNARWGEGAGGAVLAGGAVWTLQDGIWSQVWNAEQRLLSFNALAARGDEVWIAYREWVVRLSGGEATLFDALDGVGSGSGGAAINWSPLDIAARGSDIWVGTGGGGISRFDGSRWETFDEGQGLPHRYVVDIEVGPGDDLWLRLGEDGRQVVVFRP